MKNIENSRELSRHLVKVKIDLGDEARNGEEPHLTPFQRLRRWILVLLFFVPVTVAFLYNFLLASPRYASEMSFVVRTGKSPSSQFSLMGITQTQGQDDSEAIVSFVESRSLIARVNRDGLIRRIFSAPGVDSFNRFPSLLAGNSNEAFYRHFGRYVHADFDRATGVTKIEVQAFSAKDSQEVAKRILTESEGLVNRLSKRARNGLVSSAERDVQAASIHLGAVLRRLSVVRGSSRVLDPKMETAAAIKLAAATADRLSRIDIELMQAMASVPESPLIAQLRTRRAAIEEEVRRQGREMVGGPSALATRMQGLEQIGAERDIAEKRLLAASVGLIAARRSADRQQLYVEHVAEPSLPDEARYPRAWRNTFIALLISAAMCWIAVSLAELVVGDE